jgi:hypothetical protein
MRFVPSTPLSPRRTDGAHARRRPGVRAALLAAPCLALALAASACEDSPTDPMASLVTPETAPALEVRAMLPTLPDLAARTGTEARLSEPVVAWIASWEDQDGGAEMRRSAVARSTPTLAGELGASGAAQVLAPLFRAAHSLEALTEPPEALRPMLAEVHERVARARSALEEGRAEEALREGLLASDRIRAASPEQVARALVARGEQALSVLGSAGPGPTDDPDRERGEQLLKRARQALESGDYAMAVQRAFYACQLLQDAPRS